MSNHDQNHDIESLLRRSVSDVAGGPEPTMLTHRLRRVDRWRHGSQLVAVVSLVLGCSVGVAAAWPSSDAPFEIRVGTNAPQDIEPAPTDAERGDQRGDATDDDHSPAAISDYATLDDFVPAEPTKVPQLELSTELAAALELAAAQPASEPVAPAQPAPTPHPTPAPTAPPAPPAEHVEDPPDPEAEPEHEEPEQEAPASHPFTAASAYGSCEEEIPYDIYSGHAAPGATVTLTSPWSATTTAVADEDGYWAVQVTFETAPVGDPFTVTAASGGSQVGLSFVRTA